MKSMTLRGASAPKNEFLRIPTAHRHHWRGYPYIILQKCGFATKKWQTSCHKKLYINSGFMSLR